MKKRINILLLAGLLFSAVACDDSENNFSESTSTRIEQTLERYKFALQAGKTWVMEYFPDENLGYGGGGFFPKYPGCWIFGFCGGFFFFFF